MGPDLYNFPLFAFGWTGVDLFFVLSGYLIGKHLWHELKTKGTIDFFGFFIRRGLRIWPLYFAILLATFFSTDKDPLAFWPDATFLSNYFHHQVGGGWTLSTEEQFYLISPLSLLVTSRLLNSDRQICLVVFAIAMLPILRAITIYNAHGAYSGVTAPTLNLIMPFHTHSDGLFVGLFLSWITVFHYRRQQSLSRLTKVLIFSIVTTTSIFARFLSSTLFGFTALGLIYGALVFCTLSPMRTRPATPASRFAYFVSRLSFGIYLNHFLILSALLTLLHRGLIHIPPNTFGFACFSISAFLACISMASVTFFIIEVPFLNIRDRWLAKRTAAAERTDIHEKAHVNATKEPSA